LRKFYRHQGIEGSVTAWHCCWERADIFGTHKKTKTNKEVTWESTHNDFILLFYSMIH
jgi:hypothetical protein